MTPLTVDCARVRQLLPALHDPEAVAQDERAFAEQHIAGCAACAQARGHLDLALGALRDLPPEDLARLAALADARSGPSPGAVLALAGVAALLLLAVALALAVILRPSAPPAAAPRVAAAPVRHELPREAWPGIGVEHGLEVDPTLEDAPGSTGAPPAPPDVEVAISPPPPSPAPPAIAPEPEPVAVAVAPARPAPGPAPARAARMDPPAPLPDPTREMLLRLQVSKGVGYRDVTVFVVRDPDARDRPTRGRGPALVVARETSPPDPLRCAVRPPAGDGDYDVLLGELLDAPCGLRVVPTPARIRGRATTLDVLPVAFDGVAALEGRARRDPVLKGPVLLPSRSRAALISGATPGPVAVLLDTLADPTLLEFRRLREELARLEAEARDLERRLRPLIEDVRGVRGLGVSISPMGPSGGPMGTPQPRSLDLFASARDLSDALPRLLRTALLEAAIERPQTEQDLVDAVGDVRPRALTLDVEATRADHQAMLTVLAAATRDAASPATTPVFRAVVDRTAGAAYFDDAQLRHAVVVRVN